MKRHTTRLNQKEELTANQQNDSQGQTTLEFQAAEQAIRHDCSHIRVPHSVAERLQRSVAAEPSVHRSWWKRWFGR